MKSFTLNLLLVLLFSCSVFANETNNNFSLYLCISSSYKFQSQNYLEELIKTAPVFKTLSEQYGFILARGIVIDEKSLERMEKSAIDLTGSSSNVSKLRQILKVVFNYNSNEKVYELYSEFKKISLIDYCTIVSNLPVSPPSDIFPQTPSLENNQQYIEVNPGVNMRYAWNVGAIGSGIKVRDIEYGFNKNHEELNDKNVFIAPDFSISPEVSNYTDHGTYVLGIVYGDKGNYGISGLAYGADGVLLFPEWQESGHNRIYAVSKAIENSGTGDVVIYEMQEYGQNNNLVPAEFNPVIWDLTKAATDSGIVIVAAAGNGRENLDSIFYNEYRNRGDSGAIIVGAGTPDLDHDRISFSTYGSRVDLQGWGYGVYSSGYYYGNVTLFGNDINQSYGNFSGTSSATSMIASCAIVLQSYYKSITGANLTSLQLRNILILSGIPQGSQTSSFHIGPLPNMQNAIQKINTDYLSINEFSTNSVIVCPNPFKNLIHIKPIKESVINGMIANLYSMDGKIILKNISLDQNPSIDVSFLNSGVFILELIFDNKRIYKKIVKN